MIVVVSAIVGLVSFVGGLVHAERLIRGRR